MAKRRDDTRFEDYFTLSDTEAMCDICSHSFSIDLRKESINTHLERKHNYPENALLNDSYKHLQHYEIQNNRIKCNKNCEHIYSTNNKQSISREHLELKHNISKDTAKKIYEWLREEYNFDESCGQYHCTYCQTDSDRFVSNRFVRLMKHLFEKHDIHPSKNTKLREDG